MSGPITALLIIYAAIAANLMVVVLAVWRRDSVPPWRRGFWL
jgi:hypothetical protein